MACPNCGSEIPMRKSMGLGKSVQPDECPDCGTDLTEKADGNRLEKGVL